MAELTIAGLFEQAAARIRADFEYIRATNPHAGEKGQEAEGVLRDFLNAHLPRRFRADAGVVIDFDNQRSRQEDVLVYDALSSPLYRAAERMNIIPSHTVAAVIEVKSKLTKAELTDSYDKIASVKGLKRLPLSEVDRDPTSASGASIAVPFGAVFAFDSDSSLEAIAENMKALNQKTDSRLWPDLVIVLDKGVLTYAIQWPGAEGLAGSLLSAAPPPGGKYGPPPWYVQLLIHPDEARSLNRFFLMMLTHLTFFPFRSGVPPFERMLGATKTEALTIQGYQYNLAASLREVPPSLYNENNPRPNLEIQISSREGQPLAFLQYVPWQDGACIRKYGPLPLEGLLPLLSRRADLQAINQTPQDGTQLSTVFPLTEAEFREWVPVLESRSNMKAKLVEGGAPPASATPGGAA